MSIEVLTNVRIFYSGVDLTGVSNKVEMSVSSDKVDSTPFGTDGWKTFLGGLFSTTVGIDGYWDTTDGGQDEVTMSQIGQNLPLSVFSGQSQTYAQTTTPGSVGYFTQAGTFSYKPGGKIGQIASFSATSEGAWPLVRGRSLHHAGTPRTATGTGTPVQLGAVPTGRHLYAALHVLSVSGTSPSITVRVESDIDDTFASPVTQATFGAKTAPGGEILRTAGPIADTWYRAAWTISGTSPSFLFVVVSGIK